MLENFVNGVRNVVMRVFSFFIGDNDYFIIFIREGSLDKNFEEIEEVI